MPEHARAFKCYYSVVLSTLFLLSVTGCIRTIQQSVTVAVPEVTDESQRVYVSPLLSALHSACGGARISSGTLYTTIRDVTSRDEIVGRDGICFSTQETLSLHARYIYVNGTTAFEQQVEASAYGEQPEALWQAPFASGALRQRVCRSIVRKIYNKILALRCTH